MDFQFTFLVQGDAKSQKTFIKADRETLQEKKGAGVSIYLLSNTTSAILPAKKIMAQVCEKC